MGPKAFPLLHLVPKPSCWTWLPCTSVLSILSAPVCPLASPLTAPVLVYLHHTCIGRVVMHSVMISVWQTWKRGQRDDRGSWGVNGEAGVKSNSRDNQVPLGLSWHLLTEGWWRPRSRCLGLTFWGKVPPWQKDWAVWALPLWDLLGSFFSLFPHSFP